MPSNAFSLHAAARNVTQMLRSRLQSAPDAAAELHAAIEEIQTLWEELKGQSDILDSERQRYADFFEYAPDPYVITEPQGEIREANRSARELLGAKDGGLDGTSLVSFILEPERPGFRGRLVAVRGRPEGEAEEWMGSLVPVAGHPIPVRFRVRSIKVRRKNADGLCWLIRRAS
ncbi:MAG: PAS domain-containing protein [Betaproteobacteria bacterium]|nr:PAS domain-containing protein [Betaproteobacteria bacterium]